MFNGIRHLLTLLSNKKQVPPRDIRFSDPTHDKSQWSFKTISADRGKPLPIRSQNQSQVRNEPSPSYKSERSQTLEMLFKNQEILTEAILFSLQTAEGQSLSTNSLDNMVVKRLVPDVSERRTLRVKNIRHELFDARGKLLSELKIGYNKAEQVWFLKRQSIHDLTPKEKSYLSHKGLGDGWRHIDKPIEAIDWLYKNFSPEEFENFCNNILSNHCEVSVTVTEKRSYSGADGGLDGMGSMVLEGKVIKVAVQAKRYHPSSQVGENYLRDFSGALTAEDCQYGIIMTTGLFSERAKAIAEVYRERGQNMELIDQSRLVEIMLTKNTQPHGFGLHRTDIGRLYINERILRSAARKPLK